MKGGSYLLPALLKTLILPPLLTHLFIIYLHLTLPILLRLAIYCSSLPLSYILRTHLSVYLTDRAAHSAGAAPIPKVKGRYPLNIDILLDWARSGSEEEVGRMMVLLARKYGNTYNTRVLGEDQIITSDPRVIRHALIDDFDTFVKGHKTRSRAEAFLGDGIFNADGERWKSHRALTRPFFHPTHVSPALSTPHILSTLKSLPTADIELNTGKAKAFDMQEAMGELSLHMAIDWLCGVKLDEPHTRGTEWEVARRGVGEAMRLAQAAVGRRIKIGTAWPFFELRHDPLAGPMEIIHAFFRPLILEAILRRDVRKSHTSATSETKTRLIDRLVEATDDLKLVEDQLINILLAARDTTSSLLTFCIYALTLHPEIYTKLSTEILFTAGLDGAITKETIRDCPYTRRVINETLRLFSPVPLNIRRTLRPSLLPTSTGERLYIPGNTSLVMATILMQRDEEVWGEDADEFRPERWETQDEEGMKGREGFAAWNLGPRMCLGQPFALTAVHTFLILLVRHLASSGMEGMRIELAPDAQPEGTRISDEWTKEGSEGDGRGRGGREKVWVVADVVLAIKGGLWVRFVN